MFLNLFLNRTYPKLSSQDLHVRDTAGLKLACFNDVLSGPVGDFILC